MKFWSERTARTKLGKVMVDWYPDVLCSAVSFFKLFIAKKNRNLNIVEGRIHKLYGT